MGEEAGGHAGAGADDEGDLDRVWGLRRGATGGDGGGGCEGREFIEGEVVEGDGGGVVEGV